jgi:hypothetical protein
LQLVYQDLTKSSPKAGFRSPMWGWGSSAKACRSCERRRLEQKPNAAAAPPSAPIDRLTEPPGEAKRGDARHQPGDGHRYITVTLGATDPGGVPRPVPPSAAFQAVPGPASLPSRATWSSSISTRRPPGSCCRSAGSRTIRPLFEPRQGFPPLPGQALMKRAEPRTMTRGRIRHGATKTYHLGDRRSFGSSRPGGHSRRSYTRYFRPAQENWSTSSMSLKAGNSAAHTYSKVKNGGSRPQIR